MRFYFILIIIFTSLSISNAQTITLKILGVANYSVNAESNGVIVTFSKSDLKSKKLNLLDSLSVLGIKEVMTPIEMNHRDKKRYRIEVINLELFDKLLVLVSNLKITIEKIYYKIPEHKFEDEDVNAISAFNHASTQAKMIANHLNYKITKVLNIDDDTTESSYLYDRYDNDTAIGKRIIKFWQQLGGENNLFETESSIPAKTGGYNLWVTFELKRK